MLIVLPSALVVVTVEARTDPLPFRAVSVSVWLPSVLTSHVARRQVRAAVAVEIVRCGNGAAVRAGDDGFGFRQRRARVGPEIVRRAAVGIERRSLRAHPVDDAVAVVCLYCGGQSS